MAMLDGKGLEKIKEKYNAYKGEYVGDVPLEDLPFLSAIATMVDLVREELNK